jgi:GT2 family glycosyltransferase
LSGAPAKRVAGGLVPGWYLVEGRGFVPGTRPELRCDGTRHDIDSTFPLGEADRNGRLRAVCALTHEAASAWLPADADDARGEVELHRVGRVDALRRMLSGLRPPPGTGRWRWLARTLADVAATAIGFGMGRAATLLVARYRAGLDGDATVSRAHAPAGLKPGFVPWAVAMRLRPLGPLESAGDSRVSVDWEATGEDPGFRLDADAAPMPLRAGWYRLRIGISASVGAIVAPALYPDYGDGYSHAEMIRLPEPDASGRIEALVLLKYATRSLRFDPSIRRARFVLRQFDLARLGRASALLRMLSGFRGADGRRDWGRSADAALAFLRTASTNGISVAAADLFSRQPYRLQHLQGDYSDWVRRYDSIGRLDFKAMQQRAQALGDGPLISLLLPAYATPETWLRRCLDSVLGQAYPHWELCVADDASPDPRVRAVIGEYARRDARIRFVFRPENGHIAEASNSALALARGEFVGLLDHDDELRPHALLEMAEAIRADPGAALLYSDEDKIDTEGRRFDPYFKPDWNHDLLLSQNYVCHFTVIRTDLVRAAGGFRAGFEGSQDHDLILRCIERLEPSRIRHIPKVLYHWRAIEGSTAFARDAKDYASLAGSRAVAEHLVRTGRDAEVEELPHGHFRVRWRVPQPAPRVCIIIPTRDRVELLRNCVDSIRALTDYRSYRIVVVDNRSSDAEALAYLGSLAGEEGVQVLRYDAEFNYSAINNWAASQCDGDVLCLLNNDIEVLAPDWLSEMVGHALRPEVGAVGAKLYYPDGTIQHAGVVLGIDGVAAHVYAGMPKEYPGHGGRALVTQALSAVTGACLVARRDVFEQVGGLDERLQVAFNDVDFCLRVGRAGYRIVWTPFAELRHHESASRGGEDTDEKKERFAAEVALMQERWGVLLLADPAYNPNLSLSSRCFELASPPR